MSLADRPVRLAVVIAVSVPVVALMLPGCSDRFLLQNAPARPAAAPAGHVPVPVLRVVDGDTLDVPEGRVRVLVVDSCETGTAGGTRATAEAHLLLDGRRVTLTGEPGRDRDRYGRLLRYVELPDGRDYGEVMVREDHTAVYAGRSDASPARVATARRLDAGGRDCGAVAASPEAPVPAPTTRRQR